MIGFEARTPILGFNVPEAVVLGNTGRSLYNSMQLGLTKRMSERRAIQSGLHLFALEGHQLRGPRQHLWRRQAGRARTPASWCRTTSAISTRTMRCPTSTGRTGSAGAGSGSCPGRACLSGFRFSGFVQMQSGLPYSIYSVEPELGNVSQFGIWCGLRRALSRRLRPAQPVRNARRPAPARRRSDRGRVQQERAVLADDGGGRLSGEPGIRQSRSERAARLLAAARGPELAKAFSLGGVRDVELRWDVFNVFDTVNYALPKT